MNIIINIDKNIVENIQPKIYNIGTITTTLQDLLDQSTIIITNYRPIIIQYTDLDSNIKQCFLNLKDYQKGNIYGLGKDINENDLIPLSGLSTESSNDLQQVLNNGDSWSNGNTSYQLSPNFIDFYFQDSNLGAELFIFPNSNNHGIYSELIDGDYKFHGKYQYLQNGEPQQQVLSYKQDSITNIFEYINAIILNKEKGIGFEARTNSADLTNGTQAVYFKTNNITGERTFEFPDYDGTLSTIGDVYTITDNAFSENFSNVVSDANILNLTASLVESNYTFTGTTCTWTLPISSGNEKKRIVIMNQGSGNLTINTVASNNEIYSAGSLVNTLNLLPGESIVLYCNGLNWHKQNNI